MSFGKMFQILGAATLKVKETTELDQIIYVKYTPK